MRVGEQGVAPLAGNTSLHRSRQRRSRFLLIINKGPGAVPIAREADAWDLMEIYFAKKDIAAIESDSTRSDANYVVFERDRNMRKFAIIKRLFERLPDLWNYDAVMMLDDDLVPVRCHISDIFDLFMQTGLRVGQPALTEDSYWSHEVVLRNARFRWRRTNFAEVMCPVMTMAALRDYIPLFDETVSGFGLDMYWSAVEWKLHGGVAVLDATPMRHTRPVRGGVAYQGLSPGEERYTFFRRHNLKNFRHMTLDGETLVAGDTCWTRPIRYRSQIVDLVKFRLRSLQRRVGFLLLFGAAALRHLVGGKAPAHVRSVAEPGRRDDDNRRC